MNVKTYFNKISTYSIVLTMVACMSGCNDFLDVVPPSDITPETYLMDEAHLEAYTVNRYSIFATHGGTSYGTFAIDENTDNQANPWPDNKYTDNLYQVGKDGGSWNFGEIYNINYFLNTVVPRWKAGEIRGNEDKIKHYIGEMYFFRAAQYFNKLVAVGDFPIVKSVQPTRKEELIEASKRQPRTEVARFIINDLDSAITMMSSEPLSSKNRLYKASAQLFKSRVALYEGTWLKYFKGTAFVPNGPGWPGAAMDYNQGYQFQAGSIDGEINWLLEQAIAAAADVAETVPLVNNTEIVPQATGESNPYLEMYGAVDMSGYSEILLWRQYDKGLGITHCVPSSAATGNRSVGLTKGMIDAFLMEDGLPIYASSKYKGDNSIDKLMSGRDGRMQLFVKVPGQVNGYISTPTVNTKGHVVEPYPDITSGSNDDRYSTGYTCRKGWNPNIDQWWWENSYTGCIIFRATEAYLNYIEAYYERYDRLDDKAIHYWKQIRNRAGVNEDFNKTIAATDISKEAAGDWGAYSAGQLLSDATLYNIRRERRVELMAEGARMMDLKRWRALEQMKSKPYHLEGFKLWNSDMTSWYDGLLKYDGEQPNVSSPALSDYLRPQEIQNNVIVQQGGLKWKLGHYLEPIAIEHFMATSNQAEGFTDSPIYQNPYWGLKSAEAATE